MLDFPMLQGSQSVCRFSSTVSPPKPQAKMWSTWRTTLESFAGLVPHMRHIQLSLIRIRARRRQLTSLEVRLVRMVRRAGPLSRTDSSEVSFCPMNRANAISASFQEPNRFSYVPSANFDPNALSDICLPNGCFPSAIQTSAKFSKSSLEGMCCLCTTSRPANSSALFHVPNRLRTVVAPNEPCSSYC